MEKFKEAKVMRDPIHNYIKVELPVVWDLINTKEFQRLRRIHQLGGAYLVFHTSEHSRFGHSLGVYEIVRRMVNEVYDLCEQLSEQEKLVVMIAGLLHDLGHGPFSHAFETIYPINHEELTIAIITGNSEINQVLRFYDETLPEEVALVIQHQHPNKLLTQLISSQLDADRMDYLLRDSYFTGTKYGEFDLERILRTLRVVDKQLVIKATGIQTVEDYIMARYHMYWQIYYHATIRSFEAILILLFRRLKDLKPVERYPMFAGLFNGEKLTIDQHFNLDDCACYYAFSLMRQDEDPVISDLADRLLNRKLFTYQNISKEDKPEAYYGLVADKDPRYYLYVDTASQIPYRPYLAQTENLIKVLGKDGKISELSEISNIVLAIVKGEIKEDYKIFYPL